MFLYIEFALRNWLRILSLFSFSLYFWFALVVLLLFCIFLLYMQRSFTFEFNPKIERAFRSQRKKVKGRRAKTQGSSIFFSDSMNRKWPKNDTPGFCYPWSLRHFIKHRLANRRSEQLWAQTSPYINGKAILVRKHPLRRSKLTLLDLFRGDWRIKAQRSFYQCHSLTPISLFTWG